MDQVSLIYCYVARRTVILANYTEHSKEHRLQAPHIKYCLVEDGFIFCVVAVDYVDRKIPTAFLERVKEDFNKRYGGGKANNFVANSLNKEFGWAKTEGAHAVLYKSFRGNQQVYKSKCSGFSIKVIHRCLIDPEVMSKFTELEAKVSEVKDELKENIDKVVDRGATVETLVGETEKLNSQAQ